MKTRIFSFLLFLTVCFACKAQNRTVLVEEFTGMWCGDCPRGRTATEHLDSVFGNQVICIGMHSGDTLASAYSEGVTKYCDVTEFPLAFIDRTSFPASGGVFQEIDQSAANLDPLVSLELKKAPVLDITLKNSYDAQTRQLSVDLDLHFLKDLKGKMRVNCLVVEDSVRTNHGQANYMNNDPSSPWYHAGNPVAEYVQRNVARDNLSAAIWGDGNLLPKQVLQDARFSQTYSYTLPAAWNARHIKLVCFVSAWGSAGGVVDTSQFSVLNAAEAELRFAPATGIAHLSKELLSVSVYPNPFYASCNLRAVLAAQEQVVLEVFNASGQALSLLAKGTLPAGPQQFDWDGRDQQGIPQPAGLYFFRLRTGSSCLCRPVVLSR